MRKNLSLEIEEIGYTESGQLDRSALKPETLGSAAAVVVQSPNFFGVLEDLPALAEIAHGHGSLLLSTITEAVSLGIVRPPAEADIVALEGQAFGIGLLPATADRMIGGDRHARQVRPPDVPGRLAGRTSRRRR